MEKINFTTTNSLVFWIISNNTNALYLDELSDRLIKFEFIQWNTNFEAKNPNDVDNYKVYKAKRCKLKDFCFGKKES